MVAGGEVEHPVVAEVEGPAMVFGVGDLGILVENQLTARHRACESRVGREAREAIDG